MTDMTPKNVVLPSSNENEYPLLRGSDAMQQILVLFQDNLGEGGSTMLRDLPRAKCGAGGATSFLVETSDGEVTEKEIEGIIVARRTARVYWHEQVKAGRRRPPDCFSRDGLIGEGDPGGDCSKCAFSQYGSAPRGNGQACRQVKQLLMIRPGEILPSLIVVPPTSLRACHRYFVSLTARNIAYWGVVTRIRLERATSEDGNDYARMLFAAGRQLTDKELLSLAPYHKQMQQLLDPIAIDARDYATEKESMPGPRQTTDTTNPGDVPF
jgi:hypothetical protein